ncbi:MAG: aromatic amino acid lyase, partial [Patescibacteria group bacterium]
VDSIPTSANVEDLVSMGTIAARKARNIIENLESVLTIEIMTACQAIDFRLARGFKLGKETNKWYKKVRNVVPFFEKDEEYYPYIEKLKRYLFS